jgi:UDP-N-acetylmuramate dehydrogenase
MRMEENKPLAPLTTFGIGGPARWFVEAASEEEILEATGWARERGLALLVLGGGSNLLVADSGFDGLVLKVGLKGISVEDGGLSAMHGSGREGDVTGLSLSGSRLLGTNLSGTNLSGTSLSGTSEVAPIQKIRDRWSVGSDPVVALQDLEPTPATMGRESQRIYRVAAGEDWDRCVQRAVDDGCAGLECLAGIPGTVGGTPVQNVGAYGQEVSSVIENVRAFDLEEREFVELGAAECEFGYRRSRFNGAGRGRYVVTRVDYRLSPGGAPALRYAELQRAVAAAIPGDREPRLREVAEVVRTVRRGKGMLLVEGDADCQSAGSFFKNPVVGEDELGRVAVEGGSEPPRFATEDAGKVKLPAAWLIEKAGFQKGFRMGRAAVSTRHTLALVNAGEATAAEVMALAWRIREAVEIRFGIRLEMEPVMVGF